ncbi:MAG: lysophospholipid acyltransferase family protein [Ginsengibacter sp.]
MKNWVRNLKQTRLIKSLLYFVIGVITYPGLIFINSLKVTGMDILKKLPKRNVLFVSNHQTYFADVIVFLHIFCAIKWGKTKGLGMPYYLLNPFTRVYYVAAEQTMKASWLSRLFTLGGAITVKRTWNPDAKETRKGLNPGDTRNIARALENNWVITFPQGTTKPFAPGRKGTAFIIKHHRPIVVPVVINGFWRAFDKKGLKFKKKGTVLDVRFKEPLQINFDDSTDIILHQIMDAIEQSKQFIPAGHPLLTTLK